MTAGLERILNMKLVESALRGSATAAPYLENETTTLARRSKMFIHDICRDLVGAGVDFQRHAEIGLRYVSVGKIDPKNETDAFLILVDTGDLCAVKKIPRLNEGFVLSPEPKDMRRATNIEVIAHTPDALNALAAEAERALQNK